jgi:serine protease Do
MKKAVILVAVFLSVGLAAAQEARPEAEGQGGSLVLPENDTFGIISEAKATVFPAVVFIKPIVEKYQRGEKEAQQVTGSGVLISPEGDVVTNYHVDEKAASIRCLLYDGQYFEAEITGTDKETDLALLKLKTTADTAPLPFARFGDSDALKEGDFVMAMGAPWGLNRSVSLGIVSCARRYIPERSQYSLWLQTDASLNPGNSGGPLVNTGGEVVGINAMAGSMGGDIAFAVPSRTVERIVAALKADGKVERSWTGLRLQPLKDFNQNMYFDAEEGVIVAGADPASPAAVAGFAAGDRITTVAGEPVTAVTDVDLPEVRTRLAMLPPDREALLEVSRNGEVMKIALAPTVKGKVEGDELDFPRWNMTVKSINKFANPNLYFVRQEGVFIFGTKYPGNAASSGLTVNDIITKIDDKPVKTLEEARAVYDAVVDAKPKRTRVLIEYVRGAITRTAVLDFSKEYRSD